MTDAYTVVKVKLVDNKPTYNRKIVKLPVLLHTLLLGKGEGGTITTHLKNISYEDTISESDS